MRNHASRRFSGRPVTRLATAKTVSPRWMVSHRTGCDRASAYVGASIGATSNAVTTRRISTLCTLAAAAESQSSYQDIDHEFLGKRSSRSRDCQCVGVTSNYAAVNAYTGVG